MAVAVGEILAEFHQRLAGLYGQRLERVVLFGSHARGQAVPDSDIDVLVVLKGDVSPGAEILRSGGIVAGLSLRTDSVISVIFVSSDRFATEGSPLLLNVRREGVAV